MLNTTLQKEQEGDQQYFSLCISSFPNEIDEAGFFKATASQKESMNGIMNSNLLDSIVKDNNEIEELESRIEALESAKTSLESRVSALESAGSGFIVMFQMSRNQIFRECLTL